MFVIVYLELRRQNKNLHSIYYYKTKNNLKVDFCLTKGRKIISLIQVVEHFESSKTREREIRALTTAMDELKLNKGGLLL